jgi:uncharacterized protein involved in exopolysaccharide biosynthesis
MTNLTATRHSSSYSILVLKNWKLYLPLWLLANALIWSATLLYLKKTPPTYKSEWKIILPAAKSSSNVVLPGIGQASTSEAPASSQSSDARQNYKYLAESEDVLKAAANQLKMPVNKFGKPRIKIVDTTTLMQFEIKGDSAQEAQKKAFAFHNALEAKLEELRKEEIAQQNRSLKGFLGGAEEKLQGAQQRLSTYKAQSRLSSIEQLRDLSVNVEGLRRQRAETIAQLQQASARFRDLSASLGLSSQEAVDALVLQADPLFQQYLADYSKATTTLVNLSAKFLPAHPAVSAKQQEKDVAQAALFQQAQSLLGRSVSVATLEKLNSSSGSGSSSQRSAFFQELISLQGQEKGLQAQAQELGQQIAQLESRLTAMSQQESQLDNLQRDIRIGEAVFSSTLTRLDLSQSNLSASYPPISFLSKPNLPEKPSAPKKKIVLLGAAMGSFFTTTGMTALWLLSRKPKTTKKMTRQHLQT